MRAVQSIREIRVALEAGRRNNTTIGLVPTMGALHIGHEKLIETARRECDTSVVSIFVNPLQFGPNEDYERYPRTFHEDIEICVRHGVDFVFAPGTAEMYPLPQRTFAEVTQVSDQLCGSFRPGHFRAVATVVLKLFNIVQPQRAYFGEKDMQQLAVIRRMTADLNLPITVVPVPTVREADGLAVSSRNRYLDPEQRKVAPLLYRALQAAEERIRSGERDAAKIREAALGVLGAATLVRVEYLEVVDPDEMQPVTRVTLPARIAGAVWVGSTRLIDNIFVES